MDVVDNSKLRNLFNFTFHILALTSSTLALATTFLLSTYLKNEKKKSLSKEVRGRIEGPSQCGSSHEEVDTQAAFQNQQEIFRGLKNWAL